MKKILLIVTLLSITHSTYGLTKKQLFKEHNRVMSIPGVKEFLKVLNSTVRIGIMPSKDQIDMVNPDNGKTLLMYAVMEKNPTLLKEFIAHEKENLTKESNDESTILIYAAMQGRTDAIKIILQTLEKQQINIVNFVNRKNKYGSTALMYAAQYGSKTSVEALLDAGANPNLFNNNKIPRTAYYYTGQAYFTTQYSLKKRNKMIKEIQNAMIIHGYTGSNEVASL